MACNGSEISAISEKKTKDNGVMNNQRREMAKAA
jgi:hypothetical protein